SDDPVACLRVARMALAYRNHFKRDFFIDLIGYRRYGHNEGDDPTFTQPLMYSEVQAKKTLPEIYAATLKEQALIDEGEFSAVRKDFGERFQAARKAKKPLAQGPACAVHGMLRPPPPSTAVAAERLERIARTFAEYPDDFKPHPKLAKILEKRLEAVRSGSGIDWGLAEALAFGSLVSEGVRVRLSGQDSGRGTFSQRHLLLRDYSTQKAYAPYSQLMAEGAAPFEVYNSVLSEAGVMGFEFGYSTIARQSLVLWEGQFGDFANGAQVIIDQFLASSEAKWGELSGLVLMLPHGFEGQGPEHSSARLERYLQLSAENNWMVAYPSYAAQQFHLLRQQALVEIKRPLVVMTPKSLLRLPQAACSLLELSSGRFEPVLANDFGKGAGSLVLCSGRVYYDVAGALEKSKKAARVLRVEQLYPFPAKELMAHMPKGVKECIWVQEEPRNMGAWNYIQPLLHSELGLNASFIGRSASASPATGSHKRSSVELSDFLAELVKAV
ncbi:MAG: 2-oxoglutarate dehydrogenase E1 component, partial [Oligoflexia bacterium]|nr:2-oxoglutarate dehydrogenase E1 component [Oligoflexia bacterium]